MRTSRYSRWCHVLSIVVAVVGCGKAEPAAPETVVSPTSPQLPDRNVAAPAKSSEVVLAAATQPAAQADPIVVMHTSVGDLYVRLYEKQAPRTVSNFLGYVRSGFYDSTIFHQVESGFVAMGGGYDERRQAKPTRYTIPNEAANGLKNVRGSLAMARNPADPQSAASEFFFNLVDNAKLDHRGAKPDEFGYCVFGQVIDGLDVLDKLTSQSGQNVLIRTIKAVRMPQDHQVKPASNQSSQHRSRSPRACRCEDCVVDLPSYATEVSQRIAALQASPPSPAGASPPTSPGDDIVRNSFYVGTGR